MFFTHKFTRKSFTLSSLKRLISSYTPQTTNKISSKIILSGIFLTCTGLTLLLPNIYKYIDENDQKEVNKSLESPTLSSLTNINTASNQYFERKDLTIKLESFLLPTSNPSGYYIVYGQSGTGKSTIIRNILSNYLKRVKSSGGVIYIDCQDKYDFSKTIAKALNCTTMYQPSFIRSIGSYFNLIPYSSINQNNAYNSYTAITHEKARIMTACREKLDIAISQYKHNNDGLIPVLVLDNIDQGFIQSGEEGREVLIQLQKYAKIKAVCTIYTI